MSVVIYKCNTCKRERGFPRNPRGLETIGKCNITLGCRGVLYQIDIKPDYKRDELPPVVQGVDDWISRKVLYTHNQVIAKSEWTIVHNMGGDPVVNVFVNRPTEENPDNLVSILPDDVVLVDANTIKVRFDQSYRGIAQLVARQSDPNLLNPINPPSPQPAELVQVTNSGLLTFGSSDSKFQSSEITITVEFNTSTGSKIVEYIVDDQPDLASPWSDVNKLTAKGKVYTVRSINLITNLMTTGEINSGATAVVTHINNNPIVKGDAVILLATSPYENVDKTNNKLIDFISTVNYPIVYNAGEFLVQPQSVTSVYPLIASV